MNKMLNLFETADKNFRNEIGDYYIISKSRINDLVSCFESGTKRVNELTEIINRQQEEIKNLTKQLLDK
jgi:hypothetical protein